MKIYYYHTRPIASALKEWKEHTHPGHILYGLTHFPKNGIDPVLHPYKHFTSRWKLMWYNLHAILRCKENYDVVYGTSYRGLELLIFLRALGLFRKPIAVWHHQAVPQSKGWLKNLLSRLFYKGIDCMFFFSKALIDDSLKTGKVKEFIPKLPHQQDFDNKLWIDNLVQFHQGFIHYFNAIIQEILPENVNQPLEGDAAIQALLKRWEYC